MATIKTKKLFTEFYQAEYRDNLTFLDQGMVVGTPIDLRVAYDPIGTGAYTTHIGDPKDGILKIVLGGKMIQDVNHIPSKLTFSKVDDVADACIAFDHSIQALNWHEMGHVIFTDMRMKEIKEYPEMKYRGVLHSISNILEDPVIEVNICEYFDEIHSGFENPNTHLDWFVHATFDPQAKEYKDKGDLASFLQYLLLTLRLGETEIASRNAVWDKYKSGFYPLLEAAIVETDPTERLHKQVVFGEWLIKNIKELVWEMPDTSYPTPPEGTGKGKKGKGTPTMEPSGKASKPSRPEPHSSGEDEKEKKPKEGKDDDKPAPTEKEVPATLRDIADSVIEDEDYNCRQHRFINCKDVLGKDEEVENKIDGIVQEYIDTINDTSNYLLLLKDRRKERRVSGFTRGKLNTFVAMQDDIKDGCNTKIFDQRIKRGQDTDAIIYIMGDNSGSMSGGKSQICTQGMAVFAQACEWAQTPYEVFCFTKTDDSESGTAYTVIQKEEKDKLEDVKTYLGVNDARLVHRIPGYSECEIPFFGGNSEEWNLHYLYENRIKKSPHKNKILVVLCDGATCGNPRDLKSVIKHMEDEGVIVIGIGVCADLTAYYKNCKTFMDTRELQEGLAEFLVGIIEKYIANV